jgi:hypothetical protein
MLLRIHDAQWRPYGPLTPSVMRSVLRRRVIGIGGPSKVLIVWYLCRVRSEPPTLAYDCSFRTAELRGGEMTPYPLPDLVAFPSEVSERGCDAFIDQPTHGDLRCLA